jgi:tRNA pseudouridine32 synthase/23S rRNA pseudouridine746 synthase
MLDKLFHPISDFIENYSDYETHTINYYYEGICPQTGEKLSLPRNLLIEKIAYQLMKLLEKEDIYNLEGKMYGVLLVENNEHQLGVIKAFSGLINGKSCLKGWVSEISGKKAIALAENLTLTKLDQIKQEIIALENLPIRTEYENLLTKSENIRKQINSSQQKRKQLRQETRQLLSDTISPEIKKKLEEESRLDGIEKRNFKRHWQKILQPLQEEILKADYRILELKRDRKELSRNLQLQMQTAYSLTNFAGLTLSLSDVIKKQFIPTGTGECCAPKLLHYAANNNLKPLAMAEFWWGKDVISANKIKSHFYPACEERCQPLMGFLLSGITPNFPTFNNYEIPIIYEDEYLLVVDKPSGLLSVPGRGSNHYDSVQTHLNLKAVHRLDQDTSGLLILAKNQESYRKMKGLFEEKKVKKVYQAILENKITRKSGIIDLPLWGNPEKRPYQEVNWEKGKPSQTLFQVIGFENNYTRMQFQPLTGRTHQIRVHSREGLEVAIWGDRLYGNSGQLSRLHLHASEIEFLHPMLNKTLNLKSETPF